VRARLKLLGHLAAARLGPPDKPDRVDVEQQGGASLLANLRVEDVCLAERQAEALGAGGILVKEVPGSVAGRCVVVMVRSMAYLLTEIS
jgi:hypothetical protein